MSQDTRNSCNLLGFSAISFLNFSSLPCSAQNPPCSHTLNINQSTQHVSFFLEFQTLRLRMFFCCYMFFCYYNPRYNHTRLANRTDYCTTFASCPWKVGKPTYQRCACQIPWTGCWWPHTTVPAFLRCSLADVIKMPTLIWLESLLHARFSSIRRHVSAIYYQSSLLPTVFKNRSNEGLIGPKQQTTTDKKSHQQTQAHI